MKRVVVTGIGVVSPVGVGLDSFWPAVLRGQSGIGPVESFDTAAYPVHLGAEVRGFDPAPYHRRLNAASLGRASQFAVAAARMAIDDAGIDLAGVKRARIGVSMGTTSGEPHMVERYNDARISSAQDSPNLFTDYPCHRIPGNVAAELQLNGPTLMIPTACAAGNYAIGYAFDLVRTGRVDMMLAGGSDAFSRIPYTGFAQLGAIAPERCQPFDRNRKGMVPGEGAAILVLQPLDRVEPGAKIYAEVVSYGVSCDAYHMTGAHPDGDGAMRAMSMAMRDGGVTTLDIDYVSAHGTGTKANDRIESLALHSLFGGRAARVPMSSVKSMIGHTMGAASAIEAVVCAMAVHTGWAPPTINFEEPDPDCEVDCVPNQARKIDPRIVLNNAYAFGGNNASLCVRRYEG